MDFDNVITDLEDRGTPWDNFAWGISVGMVRIQRDYRAKWGGFKKAASGQPSEAHGMGAEGRGVAAITQPRFCTGVEVALHQGIMCVKTMGNNHKWVPPLGKPT